MSNSENGFVRQTINDGVGEIEFYHPASNSLPGTILKKLAEAVDDFNANNEVQVISIKSAGERAFCAGASFDELVAISDEESGHQFFSGFSGVINAIRKADKFVVMRLQGKAVGGGVGLAAAADYCIAHRNASVKLSELAIGIGPFVVGPAVRRKVGLAGFSALTIDASSWRDADWAKNHGLFDEVYDTIEEVDKAVAKQVDTLKSYSPEAMKELKHIFWKGTEDWDRLLDERAAISGRLVLSDFTKNAIAAFKKQRK